MPLKLSELTKLTKDLVVSFEGTDEKLRLSYRPRAWTPTIEAAHREAVRDQRLLDANSTALVAMVAEWDLVDDRGKVIPLSTAGLAEVSSIVQSLILAAILEDIAPDPTPAATSADGSLRAD